MCVVTFDWTVDSDFAALVMPPRRAAVANIFKSWLFMLPSFNQMCPSQRIISKDTNPP